MTQSPFIGVVCGLQSEARVIRRVAASEKVQVAISGASAARAEIMATDFCRDGARAILSIGVSGGLAPDLVPGDLILGETVRTKGGDQFAATGSLLTALELERETIAMQRATLFGSDEIIASVREKSALFDRYGTTAVDMESHGAALAARTAGIPFMAVRAIADPASRALPLAALNAVAPDGSTRTLAVLLECVKTPGQFPALLQLGSDSEKALATLRRDLGGLFRRLLFSLDL